MSSTTQLEAWLNGTPSGGPNSDGRYPLVYADGQTYLVYCPAAQALNPALNEQPIEVFANTASAAANTATTQAGTATTASLSAQTSAANALASQNAAAASATTASTQATAAGTSATNAGNSATAAAGSATTASTANTNAGLARDKAQKWADENVDTTVEPSKYSARHWAQKAADSVAGGHTHTIANVTGLQTALDAKLAIASFTWAGLSGKPATFAPSAHNHIISEVTGLQTALDGKQASLGFTPINKAGDTGIGSLSASQFTVPSGGNFNSQGSNAGFFLSDRTSAAVWGTYVDGGNWFLWNAANGNRITVSAAGVVTFSDTVNGLNCLWRDITASRGDGTGVLFLNGAQSRYVLFDGTKYVMPGARLHVDGVEVWSPHNLNPANAANLTTGTIPDAAMPNGMRGGGTQHTDWNNANANGIWMAAGAANSPGGGGWYIGRVTVHNNDWITQEVWDFTASAAGRQVWRRQKASGVWGSWSRNEFIAGVELQENSGLFFNGTVRLGGSDFQLAANGASWVRIPRTFVQSADPGAAAADGDLWAW
jgi:hypothetical protein